MRFFNTAGPVSPEDHYCIPPLERLDADEVSTLVDQKKYFVLHAPRRTGKTSCLLALMDEIDSLVGDTLISVLRQLRAGYTLRPRHFPQSVVLCGVRDVRDYRIRSHTEKTVVTGGSGFNVKAASLRLGDFSRREISALYRQHTEETGQFFDDAAVAKVWDLTRGQPWLVNALAYEACFAMKEGRDRSRPVARPLVEQARENLVLRRETHLDQLMDKLREKRVRKVLEPMLLGQAYESGFRWEDVQYVEDLGLVRRETDGALSLSNDIYREIIPRELTWEPQTGMALQPAWYVRPQDGSLDMDKLLTAFQEFFREHSEHWLKRFDYKEAGPQLLLQAFLQRVVNGGGRVEREYGLGRMRTDLLVLWPLPAAPSAPRPSLLHAERVQKIVLELKLLRKSPESVLAEGLQQTAAYMDRCGATEGHLVVFDRRPNRSREERIHRKEESAEGKTVTVWGG